MANFSTDADLLKWEPALFRDLAVPGQRLAAGAGGTTSGLSLSDPAATLLDAGVAPGHVVRLVSADGDEAGAFEILSVESQTELLATQVGREADAGVDLPPGAGWAWAIDTFDPQGAEVRHELLARLGLDADAEGEDFASAILVPRTLRRASVFGTLVMAFEGQSAADTEGRNLAAKAALYRRLYEKEAAGLRVRLDRDGDGRGDDLRVPGHVRLRRD